jgi:diguanylate cyclase (GGDEF)-like protein
VVPYGTTAILSLIVFCFHALFHFYFGLEPLYVLPIWLSARLLGPKASLALAAGISLLLTLVHPPLQVASWRTVELGFLLRLVGFSLIAVLICGLEASYRRAIVLAYTAQLMGLLNRHGFREWRERIFGRPNENSVVVVIACDGFKQLSDRYGHEAGDQILAMLARILEHETRSSDALVRMGGDEFALVLHSATAEDAKSVLERVQVQFERRVIGAGYECSISFCIGEDEPEDHLDEVLAKADHAMYCHKKVKGQRYLA